MDNFHNQLDEAVAIILHSKKFKKFLNEYPSWEKLDDLPRAVALSMFDGATRMQKCDRCGKWQTTQFTPVSTPYGWMWECEECRPVDYFEISNYARVQKELANI